jgi:hypothetical protein
MAALRREWPQLALGRGPEAGPRPRPLRIPLSQCAERAHARRSRTLRLSDLSASRDRRDHARPPHKVASSPFRCGSPQRASAPPRGSVLGHGRLTLLAGAVEDRDWGVAHRLGLGDSLTRTQKRSWAAAPEVRPAADRGFASSPPSCMPQSTMTRARSVTAGHPRELRPVLPADRPEVQRGAADQLALAHDGRIELLLAAAAVAGFELCVGHVGGVRTE